MKKYILILILGMISAFAHAPYNFAFILFITIPILLNIVFNSKNIKQSFVTAFIFGFGYAFAGIYWITFSIMTDIENFCWAIQY